jgi:hypothetical protein
MSLSAVNANGPQPLTHLSQPQQQKVPAQEADISHTLRRIDDSGDLMHEKYAHIKRRRSVAHLHQFVSPASKIHTE